MTTIVAISDTHGQHRRLEIPAADILIHCGDITPKGEMNVALDFISWLHGLDQVNHKVFIAGNHDFCFQRGDHTALARAIEAGYLYGVRYLDNSSIRLDELIIHGTPWTPFFYDWAFNGLEKRPDEGYGYQGGPGHNATEDGEHPLLSDVYSQIPPKTNIIVCHGPPRIDGMDTTSRGNRVGSYELLKRLSALTQLKAGFYGHIHESFGSTMRDGVLHSNVCSLHRDYTTIRQPIPFEI